MTVEQPSEGTPLPHRAARALARRGVRGGAAYWGLAERLAPWPKEPGLELAPGVWMPVDQTDWISANIYRALYERAELSLLPHLVTDGTVAVDVGANRGLYTALLSKLVGAGGTVVAVEPSERCLPHLRRLVKAAALHNVVVHQVALSRDDGEAQLHGVDREEHSGLASLRVGGVEHGPSVVVRTTRLDRLPELAGDRRVSFVKVDVEGHEPEVLAGGWSLFVQERVDAALVEITPAATNLPLLVSLLAETPEYRPYRISEGGRLRRRPVLTPLQLEGLNGDGRQYNLLLVHRERLAPVHALASRRG